MARPIAALLLTGLAAALPAAALAQAQTGTGGGPSSTIYAPNTSSVGRTMPQGGGTGASETRDAQAERTPQQKQDTKVQQGICIGCGAK